MLKKITAFLDSQPMAVFFAVWTGVYLVQILKAEPGSPNSNMGWWILIAAGVAFFFV